MGLVSSTPPSPASALPPTLNTRRSPKSDFGENKLSPSSFGISPLPTAHPTLLQQWTVRPSTRGLLRFSLDMGSSPGFVSNGCDSLALFRLAFALAPAV